MAETFGRTTHLVANQAQGADQVWGTKFQSGSAGALESMTVFIKQYTTYLGNMKCAIYDADRNLVANGVTEEKEIPDDYNDWMTFDFPVSPVVSATTDYYLSFFHGIVTLTRYKYTGDANQTIVDVETYNDFPATLTVDDSRSWEMSIYATYKEAVESHDVSVYDTVDVADVAADTLVGYTRALSVFDGISIVDALTDILLGGARNLSVFDGVSATDVLTSILRVSLDVFIDVFDGAGVADVVVSRLLSRISVFDAAGIQEFLSFTGKLGDVDVYDSTGVTEDLVTTLVNLISKYEEVTVAEVTSALASVAGISVYEDVSVLEKAYLEWWLGITKKDTTWSDVDVGDTDWDDVGVEDTEWSDVR